jgi:hypothetical protein
VFDFEAERLSLLVMPLVGTPRRFDGSVGGLGFDRPQQLGAGAEGSPLRGSASRPE